MGAIDLLGLRLAAALGWWCPLTCGRLASGLTERAI
jgi:hypothetical protein